MNSEAQTHRTVGEDERQTEDHEPFDDEACEEFKDQRSTVVAIVLSTKPIHYLLFVELG